MAIKRSGAMLRINVQPIGVIRPSKLLWCIRLFRKKNDHYLGEIASNF